VLQQPWPVAWSTHFMPMVNTKYEMLNLNMQALYATEHSVALVRERTIPTELPPPVGEVSANFCG